MKFIQPKAEVWKQEIPPMILSTDAKAREAYVNLYLKGMYEHIERCGRVCYKSEDKIGDKPAEDFVKRMINSQHYAMLEHGTVYLCDVYDVSAIGSWRHSLGDKYSNNKYSVVHTDDHMDLRGIYITTNYRVIVENGWEDDLKHLCAPTKFHALRNTVCFTTNIGVSREANRHRVNSIAEESTRYCNYTKGKFGGEITYTVPAWFNEEDINCDFLNPFMNEEGIGAFYTKEWTAIMWWLWGLKCCEVAYTKQIELGMTPQQARVSLPLNTKTTLIHTAFDSDWQHFWDLRVKGTTGSPHPDMKKVAEIAYNQFEHDTE